MSLNVLHMITNPRGITQTPIVQLDGTTVPTKDGSGFGSIYDADVVEITTELYLIVSVKARLQGT